MMSTFGREGVEVSFGVPGVTARTHQSRVCVRVWQNATNLSQLMQFIHVHHPFHPFSTEEERRPNQDLRPIDLLHFTHHVSAHIFQEVTSGKRTSAAIWFSHVLNASGRGFLIWTGHRAAAIERQRVMRRLRLVFMVPISRFNFCSLTVSVSEQTGRLLISCYIMLCAAIRLPARRVKTRTATVTVYLIR